MPQCQCDTCRPSQAAKLKVSWEVNVREGLISLKRGSWSPQFMSAGQAREIIKGLNNAIDFLEQTPQEFTPYFIG